MKLQVIYNENSWTFKRPLNELNLNKINRRLPQRIQNLPNQYILQYEDFDGDMIDVTCDADLDTIRECQPNSDSITLYVQETQTGGFKKQKVFHKGMKKEKLKELVDQRINELLPEITKRIKSSIATDDLQKDLQNLSISEKPSVIERSECIPITKTTEKITHESVMCDGCEMFPIIGIRYKCAICKDFDLCEQCEDQNQHNHAMIKIRKPELAPSIIFAAVGDKPDLKTSNCLREKLPEIFSTLQSIVTPMTIEEVVEEKQTNPLILDLCQALGIRPEIAEELTLLFPQLQRAEEIIDALGDDVDFVKSTI